VVVIGGTYDTAFSGGIGATEWVSENWGSLYLASLEGAALVSADSAEWQAQVTAFVVDGDGNPVSEATVHGVWKKHSGQTSCVTGESGQCSLLSDPLADTLATFTVERIQHEHLSFHSTGRLDKEGNTADRTVKVFGPQHGNTEEATPEPTEDATSEPTEEATPEPTEEATPEPTEEATPEPTEEATPEPGGEPAEEPATDPTAEATPEPTPEPTSEPTDPVQ
jgi:hypothetical protein